MIILLCLTAISFRPLTFLWGKWKGYGNCIECLLFLIVIFVASFLSIKNEAVFCYKKYKVIHAPPHQISQYGKHFIVGYDSFDEVKDLVLSGSIGGVYVAGKNATGKNRSQIRKEIKAIQDIRKEQGLPPLFIATDQEGGVVSRLSPPLTRFPSMSSILEYNQTNYQQVAHYAALQAIELSDMGINLNFSPVVDLKIPQPNHHLNQRTMLYSRAISSDHRIVTIAALTYCRELREFGIFPTLKHFPGLGRVREDTHLLPGILNRDETFLKENDWQPFIQVTRQTDAFMMIGHVRLDRIDHINLASYSTAVIQGIIRGKMKFDGIIITDDLNMGAISRNGEEIGKIAVKALNAGADLLLFSYNGNQYYPAMYEVIKAANKNRLNTLRIHQSSVRLEKTAWKLPGAVEKSDFQVELISKHPFRHGDLLSRLFYQIKPGPEGRIRDKRLCLRYPGL